VPKIFLSTTQSDQHLVRPLFDLLHGSFDGSVYWYVLEPITTDLRQGLRGQLDEASLLVAALSIETQHRNWIEEELLFAIKSGTPLLAAALDSVAMLPRPFLGREGLELFYLPVAKEALLSRISKLLSDSGERSRVSRRQRMAISPEVVHYNPLNRERAGFSSGAFRHVAVPDPTRTFHLSVFEAYRPPVGSLIELLETRSGATIFAMKWIWHLLERRANEWTAGHRNRLVAILRRLRNAPSLWRTRPDEVAIEIGTIASVLSVANPFTDEHWLRMRTQDYARRHTNWLLRYYGNPRDAIIAMVRHTNRTGASPIYSANELVCAANIVQRLCRMWSNHAWRDLTTLFRGYGLDDAFSSARALVAAMQKVRAALDGHDASWFHASTRPLQRLELQLGY